MKSREDPCDSKSISRWRSRCSAMSTMIYWEAQSNEMKVACSACGSIDTQVSFEFLRYTRHTCRVCSTTFTHSGGLVQRRDHDDDALADDVGTCTKAAPSALRNPVLAVGAP